MASSHNYPSSAREIVLKVICYFDVFEHPLEPEEIERNCSLLLNRDQLTEVLKELVEEGLIVESGTYYFLSSRPKNIVDLRQEKERRATNMSGKSLLFSRLIGACPFVEGVCLSGSLSKGVMDQNGDIDYFIITRPSRLWIARSFLILFKKIFLFNSHKYFCPNYFVDTDHLFIPDQNIFTATEISYLKPLVNYPIYVEFMKANAWTKGYLPARSTSEKTFCRPGSTNLVKRLIEFLLSGMAGEQLDNLFFRITLRRWKKKFPHFDTDDFNLNLRTRKNVSKHHPRGYQQKVLTAYEERLALLKLHPQPKLAKVA